MQRKNSDLGNIGPVDVHSGQPLNYIQYEKLRSSNSNISDYSKHNSTQLTPQIMNSKAFSQQITSQQTIQGMRATSPTQNYPRSTFPLYAPKNSGAHTILQNAMMEVKMPSPHNSSQFG